MRHFTVLSTLLVALVQGNVTSGIISKSGGIKSGSGSGSGSGSASSTFPTASPSALPSTLPSVRPTDVPTLQPTTSDPTLPPSAIPTLFPTVTPTNPPTPTPSLQPTNPPSVSPTLAPTGNPTTQPSLNPTANPSAAPTALPSVVPTSAPTRQPTALSYTYLWLRVDGLRVCESLDVAVTNITARIRALSHGGLISVQEETSPLNCTTRPPTASPTPAPSAMPSTSPTALPSVSPTATPTDNPTTLPTALPSVSPTALPTGVPTTVPTPQPTLSPTTSSPTASPSTTAPSLSPTAEPSHLPTTQPSHLPTTQPSPLPTTQPSPLPTTQPSHLPTVTPTEPPTASPTSGPTQPPTVVPTALPTSLGGSGSGSGSGRRRLRQRRSSTCAAGFSLSSPCTRCLSYQWSSAGSECQNWSPECTAPTPFEVVAPTNTNNRICGPAGDTHALIVFQISIDAAQADEVAQALEMAATNGSFDGSLSNGNDYRTALPVPTAVDRPLEHLIYQNREISVVYEVVTCDIASVSNNNNLYWANPDAFWNGLYDNTNNTVIPSSINPFGTTLIKISSTVFEFRIVSEINFTSQQPWHSVAYDPLRTYVGSTTFTSSLFNGQVSVALICTVNSIVHPNQDTPGPTSPPTVSPTISPTTSPTTAPTTSPTVSPTTSPTISPTISPSVSPTSSPTASPTLSPTVSPSTSPTNSPTTSPTISPTQTPTQSPTLSPTTSPSASPTLSPTTTAPTESPTASPTTLDFFNSQQPATGGGGGGGGGAAAAAAVVVVLLLVVGAVLYRQKRNDGWPFGEGSNASLGASKAPGSYGAPHHEVIQMRPTQHTAPTIARPTVAAPPKPTSVVNPVSASPELELDDEDYASVGHQHVHAEIQGTGSDRGLLIPPLPKLTEVQTHPIATADLAQTIVQMSANSDFAFSEEYECLETGNEFSREAARLAENKMKNRYANILPYDYTRVRLSEIPGDQYSDYVNANYISGNGNKMKYIAAQGPTQLTVIDFWRMLWEAKVPVVVMVTNCEEKGRIKCHRYWPSSVGEPMPLLEGFHVTWTHTEEFPDFVIRTLRMVNGRDRFTVKQFHYTSWPDHGVPESTAAALMMLRKARAARTGHDGPMLVHCSAGVGRTGTLLAIDINIDKMANDGQVDVYGTLNQMRRERNTVVQTEEQYIFIYRALADASSNMNTEMNTDEVVQHCERLRSLDKSGSTLLEIEFKQLGVVQSSMNFRTDSAQLGVNKAKNRFQNVLPYESTRVKLVPLPGVIGSDYINASFIDGYTNRHAYIATQGPLENTLSDFWRLIWEREVDIVVMLTQLVENGRAKSDQYWPDKDEGTITFGDFQVVLDSEYETVFGWERSVTLIDLVSETSRRIKQFQYTKWPEGDQRPDSEIVRALFAAIKLHQDSKIVLPEENIYGNASAITEHAIAAQTKPLLVHDSAGVGRTGAFCALHISMKKLDMEKKVDLFTVVKHMRTQRMSMVQTPNQYEWVYCVLSDCIMNKALTEQLYVNLRSESSRRRMPSNADEAAAAAPPRPSLPPAPPPKQSTLRHLPPESSDWHQDSAQPDDFDEHDDNTAETSLMEGSSFGKPPPSSPPAPPRSALTETVFSDTVETVPPNTIEDDFDNDGEGMMSV